RPVGDGCRPRVWAGRGGRVLRFGSPPRRAVVPPLPPAVSTPFTRPPAFSTVPPPASEPMAWLVPPSWRLAPDAIVKALAEDSTLFVVSTCRMPALMLVVPV